MEASEQLKRNLEFSIEAKRRLLKDAEILFIFSQVVATVIDRYRSGGRLYIALPEMEGL